MRMVPIFLKVHALEDPSIVYRINTNTIDYYRAEQSSDSATLYTVIHFNIDKYVKVSESVEDIDRLLGVDDDD